MANNPSSKVGFPSSGHQSSQDSQEKRQPWRSIWPFAGMDRDKDIGVFGQSETFKQARDDDVNSRFIVKNWYNYERGHLLDEQEQALAQALAGRFSEEPWYELKLPNGRAPCPICGSSRGCSCSVFEGG